MNVRKRQDGLVPAYTICLYVLALVALTTIFSHQMVLTMMVEEGKNGVVIAVLRFLQAFEAIIFLATLSVAVLRSKGSSLARPTTAAASIMLALWPPFGTMAFIWWVVWIRPREAIQERRSDRLARGLCPRCEYNLEGNVSGVCPECGERI